MERLAGGVVMISCLAGCLAPAAAAGLGDGELTLLGAAASGDFGTGLDADSQWLAVRWVAGDDLQLRVDLSMVSVSSGSGVVVPAPGSVATGRGWRGAQDAGSAGSPSAGGVESPASSRTTGLGDLYVAVSKRIAGGGVRLFRIDTNLEVKVPTASEDEDLGTGEWDYRVGFAGEYRLWSATAWAGVGWNRLGDPTWVELGDVVDLFVGVDSAPLARERLVVSGWVEGWQEAVDSAGPRALLGVGVATTGKIRWRLRVQAGLTDAAPDLAVVLGVSFGTSPPGPGVRGPQP